MSFQIGGIISGLNTSQIIEQLMSLERQSRTRYVDQLNMYQWRQDAIRGIKTDMLAFKTTTSQLADIFSYTPMSAQSTDSTVVDAETTSSSLPGTYRFQNIVPATTETWSSSLEMSTNFGNQVGTTATLDVNQAWAAAGFGNTPNGTITITINGTTTRSFNISDYTTPQALMTAVNNAGLGLNLSAIGGPGPERIMLTVPAGTEYALAETGSNGFFSEAGLRFIDTTATLETINNYLDNNFATGAFTLNGQTINLDITTDTIDSLIGKINNADADVTAYYDANVERIILSRDTAGDLDIEITNDTANFQNAARLAGASAGGTNLTFDLNGVSMERTSNTFEINNTTFTILQGTDPGESVTVTVAEDTDAIVEQIQAWLDEYNDILNTIHTYLTEKRVENPTTDADKKKGMLANDSTLRGIYSELYRFTTTTVANLTGNFDRLQDIGITRDSSGALTITDEQALRSAISDDMASLGELFTNTTAPGDDGIAIQLEKLVTAYTRVNTGYLTMKLGHEEDGEERIESQLERFDAKLEALEKHYWDQFTAMEEALGMLQSQSSWIANQAAALNQNWAF